MNKPEKLILTIKETRVYEVEVSEENGYDAFPDNLLEMVDYINNIKGGNLEGYIEDNMIPTEHEVNLLSIEE